MEMKAKDYVKYVGVNLDEKLLENEMRMSAVKRVNKCLPPKK